MKSKLQFLIYMIVLVVFMGACDKADEGVTPLMRAAKTGDLQAVNRLIQSDQKIDKSSRYSWTPLMFAAREGHVDIVAALLKAGAKVEHVSDSVSPSSIMATRGGYYPTTALAESIRYGHDEVSHLLIKKVSHIHPIEMIAAAQYDKSYWLHELVSAGGDPKRTSELSYYSTVLQAAAASGNLETVKWLVDKHKVDINPKSNETDVLEQAVKKDRVEIVKFLLENGADPNATYPDTTMPTVLITAIKTPYAEHEKNLAIIEALVRAGANPELKPSYSLFGLGVIGERRNAIDIAKAKIDEYSKYYANENQPKWKKKKLVNLNHRKAILLILESKQ
ncbi:MAG: ankyrin repeat domain-containing protein [Gammaproteobacteria bacterium]|nr:ankyrin repeat domain-containing protein [Gammaproteobacteria bacterium]